MDFIISFFRDILSGPLYIVIAIFCGILFCACIGYLAEKSQKKKALANQYVKVANVSTTSPSNAIPSSATTNPVVPQVTTTNPQATSIPPQSAVEKPAATEQK